MADTSTRRTAPLRHTTRIAAATACAPTLRSEQEEKQAIAYLCFDSPLLLLHSTLLGEIKRGRQTNWAGVESGLMFSSYRSMYLYCFSL
jgi:hypothetical protein